MGGKDLQPPMLLWTHRLRDLLPSRVLTAGLTAKGLWPPPTSVGLRPPGLIAFATHCLLDLCACIFRLSPKRNCFVAGDKWPDQLHATASLLLSGESNLYCHLERQGYLTIAKLNSLLTCSEKFVSKFHEFLFKCTRVSIKMILIWTNFYY